MTLTPKKPRTKKWTHKVYNVNGSLVFVPKGGGGIPIIYKRKIK